MFVFSSFLSPFARFSAILLVGALLLGCASAEVVSNKDPDYNGTIDGLYFQSSVSERLDRFPEEMVATMRLPLIERGVSFTASHDVYTEEAEKEGDDTESSGPSLEEESKQTVEVDFETARTQDLSHVLVVREEDREEERSSSMVPDPNGSGMIMSSSVQQTYTFSADLYVTETEERVWRASIEASGDGMTTQGMEAGKAADKMIETMDADQLLPDRMQTTK
jgi:hypothetical protein